MANIITARLTLEQIHFLVPKEARENKYLCPLFHQWHLSIDRNTREFNCFTAGCDATTIASLMWAEVERRANKRAVDPAPHQPPSGPGMRFVDYAMAKHLPSDFLDKWFGVSEGKHPYYTGLNSAVAFPYFNERGEHVTTNWRWGMGKKDRRFLRDTSTYLYGGHVLQMLEQMAERGEGRDALFLGEGESNTQTMWLNGLPCLGLPGVGTWKDEWASLKCFQAAKWIYFLLDMENGKPQDVALAGARKVAKSFPPGKVRVVELPVKDVSDLWLWHMSSGFGHGADGFMNELREGIVNARPVIAPEQKIEVGDDLGDEVLDACPILKEFVALTLPETETDVNNLVCDFLACAGAAIGLKAYGQHLADKHPPATYHLLIGNTSIGKGTSWSCAHLLFKKAVPDWDRCIRRSARSSQALIRMLKEVSEPELVSENENETGGPNPKYTEGRLLLRSSEAAAVFKSMRAEWSTLSQALRDAYDGVPLSNERGQEENSVSVNEPYALSVIGDITPWELSETLEGVDFANGVANRFIWCRSRRTKVIPHAERTPDYTALAQRLHAVVPDRTIGAITYSEEAKLVWENWVYSLPLDDEGRLGSACGRMRANALRIAILFAVLDERRLLLPGPVRIESVHVNAATSILNRHRATVAWFLDKQTSVPTAIPEKGKDKLWRQIEKVRASLKNGRITGSELYELFKHETVEHRAEIARAAGLTLTSEVGEKGRTMEVWS